MPQKAYARAGVDIDLANRLKSRLGAPLRATRRPEVLGAVGGFGGLFRASFPGLRDPVLVASIDGVGTKLKVAFMLDRHDTVGADLVNHCVNDILTLGAEPLFFLDYIGAGKLEPRVFGALIKGMSRACASAGCALLGGETAQMPGFYPPGEYDLAGCIVGIVDRKKIIDGSSVRPGDTLIGLPASGLHTNGYSLARRILFEDMGLRPRDRLPGLRLPIGLELLRTHPSYLPAVRRLVRRVPVKGMAHITGGGLVDNLPRVLPDGARAIIDTKSWRVPPLFRTLRDRGGLGDAEAYQVFNMGIGFVLIVDSRHAKRALAITGGRPIGTVERGPKGVALV
ncbi:MAG: phosphoribosylformylglycinamidine cyclo-ligase [Verrucomicrobiae bacterium]|nr:phosphoribosylformylglycinamidine cyclo-ligase [Verrucomicrobiae bacterium]